MKSKLGRLNLRDFGKGLLVAVLVVVLGSIQQLIKDKGFDITGAEWIALGDVALKATLAYLAKNLLSDEDDDILGII